jgi:hypothetical protein
LAAILTAAFGVMNIANTPHAQHVFVTDAYNNRIVRINDMTGAGWTTLGGWAAGSRVSQFAQPNGVVVTAAG